jgi:hypothetical protein
MPHSLRVCFTGYRWYEHALSSISSKTLGPLGRGLRVLALGCGDKGILVWLLGLLFLFEVVARVAFVGVLLLLLLFLGVVKNCAHRFLVGSKVVGNVLKLSSGAWALTSQLLDVFLVGGSREEHLNDVGVNYVGQLGALPGEGLNVLMKSLVWLLAVAPEIPGITRVDIGTQKVSHKNLHKVIPVVDASG